MNEHNITNSTMHNIVRNENKLFLFARVSISDSVWKGETFLQWTELNGEG